jgi:hypothetical protein
MAAAAARVVSILVFVIAHLLRFAGFVIVQRSRRLLPAFPRNLNKQRNGEVPVLPVNGR